MAASGVPARELTAMYRLHDVSLRMRGRNDERSASTVALDSVSLEIKHGERVAIMGRSGSGKSTLLHVLAGLTKPDKGTVEFRPSPGAEVVTMSQAGEDALARLRGCHIGFVYQAFHLVPRMTAAENVALPLLFAGESPAIRRERSLAMLQQFGLAKNAQRFPFELSGGEQQRVAIARALVASPSVILADEPTGNLDSESAKTLLKLLRVIHDEHHITIVAVTHDEVVARNIGSRTLHIRDGRVGDA
jgi:ABC-type lipoprotein export system ATPase subunit